MKQALTMLVSFTVFVVSLLVSALLADDLLMKFKQTDYNIKDFRVELERFDDELIRYFRLKTFKYNRTVAAVNASFNSKIDIKDQLQVLVQAYKLSSNMFRTFPIRFEVDASKSFDANIIGIQAITLCGNVKNVYFLKDIDYFVCNCVIDEARFPPLIPSGQYKVEIALLHLEQELVLLNMFVEIYRPIHPPK